MTKGILHIVVGSANWMPTQKQLEEVTQLFIDADNDPIGGIGATGPDVKTNFIPGYSSVKVYSYGDKDVPTEGAIYAEDKDLVDAVLTKDTSKIFSSGDNKRLESNTFPDSLEPDDVSYNYRALSDQEKQDMREVKILAQNLINKIRSVAVTEVSGYPSRVPIDEAIKNAQLASIWATKYITGPKN